MPSVKEGEVFEAEQRGNRFGGDDRQRPGPNRCIDSTAVGVPPDDAKTTRRCIRVDCHVRSSIHGARIEL